MRRSPRLRPPRPPLPPPPRTPPPVPAPSQAMPAPAAAGGEGPEQEQEQEFDICNDEGFVYKVPTGLYPDAAPAPSSTQAAAGPDPEIAVLRRRRRALLRLRAKRLRQLSRWEALASELLAPLPAPPRPPASQSPPPASPHPVAGTATATAASASVLDDLIAQADVQAELLKKAAQLCDEVNALCDAHEAAIVDRIAALPVWGNPREMVASLHSPDPGTSGFDEGNRGCQSLDSQHGERAIGVAPVERVKIIGDKRIQSPSPCKRCFQFGCTGETCCETPAELGDELPPPVRKRKGVVSPSSSNSVPAQASNKQKSQKASGSKSMPSGTPGSITRSRAASTPRAPDTFRSPGPTTRRRAAAKHLLPLP